MREEVRRKIREDERGGTEEGAGWRETRGWCHSGRALRREQGAGGMRGGGVFQELSPQACVGEAG